MKGTRLYIALNVLVKWVGLVANLVLMTILTIFMEELYLGHAHKEEFIRTILIALGVLVIRFVCPLLEARLSFRVVSVMKRNLRGEIYQKLLRLGSSYKEQVPTGSILQDAVEGVDQLEVYYGTLLPDFFYGILATCTLFGYLWTIHFETAIYLLLAVALIPFAIALVRTIAKKGYGEYWSQYTRVSHLFLENLQGLTTMKIYGADGIRHQKMNEESEALRKQGLKVAFLRLDTVTVMDLIACVGMALACVLAISGFTTHHLHLEASLHILVLAAEFFLPMRVMGEHFHHAMKGRASGEKIRTLLAIPERNRAGQNFPISCTLICEDLHFSYDGKREILRGINMEFPRQTVTAIVGESGCGKSTLADILMDRHAGYTGNVLVGNLPISEINEASLLEQITYVGHKPYFFHGTVRENLRLAKSSATDEEIWQVLDRVQIGDALRRRQGLETVMAEADLHLSGGQLQRIALARAILHDSSVYIFDEATSNMDGQSEHYAMEAIYALGKEKTVILISHRLPNVVAANRIYVMERGLAVESGTHESLLKEKGLYANLWSVQHRIECGREGGDS